MSIESRNASIELFTLLLPNESENSLPFRTKVRPSAFIRTQITMIHGLVLARLSYKNIVEILENLGCNISLRYFSEMYLSNKNMANIQESQEISKKYRSWEIRRAMAKEESYRLNSIIMPNQSGLISNRSTFLKDQSRQIENTSEESWVGLIVISLEGEIKLRRNAGRTWLEISAEFERSGFTINYLLLKKLMKK